MWVAIAGIEAVLALIAVFALSPIAAKKLVNFAALGAAIIAAFALMFFTASPAERTVASAFVFGTPFVIFSYVVAGGGWLHSTKKGARDRRYKHNPFIYSFAESRRRVASMGLAGTCVAALVGLIVVAATPDGTFSAPPKTAAKPALQKAANISVDPSQSQRAYVKRACYLRTDSSADAQIAGEVAQGDVLAVLENKGTWTRVAKGANSGWVSRSCADVR